MDVSAPPLGSSGVVCVRPVNCLIVENVPIVKIWSNLVEVVVPSKLVNYDAVRTWLYRLSRTTTWKQRKRYWACSVCYKMAVISMYIPN